MIYEIPFEVIELPQRGFHICCTAYVAGYKMNMLIDTGASVTVMDMGRIRKILPEVEIVPYRQPFSGIGANGILNELATLDEFSLNNLKITNKKVVLIDLSEINKVYSSFDFLRIDGLLGGNTLQMIKAVIDYKQKKIIADYDENIPLEN